MKIGKLLEGVCMRRLVWCVALLFLPLLALGKGKKVEKIQKIYSQGRQVDLKKLLVPGSFTLLEFSAPW